ncbi:MAG: phoK 2 [Acidobacteria bacterium]|nr:phoK 2 [Acidobacteriota bacterium]
MTAAAIAALLSLSTTAAVTPPKLAVVIVVDQMRADYVDRFNAEWTAGLKRMVTQGAWYQQAAYPYLTTVTCAGHATVSTGSFPHVHGVFQNAWWDRDARKQVTCTEDPSAKDVGYGIPVTGGDSAYRLQVPTFTDQMRTSRQAHVVSLSIKARSAIMLGGHGGDAITWLTDTLDGWETAAGYSEKGVPAVKAFIDANPLAADFGKTWERSLPAASYSGADDAPGEAPPLGWTRSFPHVLKGTADKVDGSYFSQWERSPFADAYVGRFAAALVQSLQLGKHDGTDVLAISFSSPDLVGHAFGPRSHEVQDMYAHLDKTIGTLFDQLDTIVGKDQWVAGLTADHGVTPIPEQLVAEGKDAGRINGGALVDAVEQVLKPALGDGRHIVVLNTNDLYFEPGVYTKIIQSRELTTAVISAIQSRPGIQRAFRSEEIRGADKSKDPLVRAAALSYFPGRSGDIVFATKPGWMVSGGGTTHGSASADDQRVPILFYGRGVKPGKYQDAVTPADVAPTLAAISGLTMKAEGHPLACVQ